MKSRFRRTVGRGRGRGCGDLIDVGRGRGRRCGDLIDGFYEVWLRVPSALQQETFKGENFHSLVENFLCEIGVCCTLVSCENHIVYQFAKVFSVFTFRGQKTGSARSSNICMQYYS